MTADPFVCYAIALPEQMSAALSHQLRGIGGQFEMHRDWEQLRQHPKDRCPDILLLPLSPPAQRLCQRIRALGDPLAIVLMELEDAPADRAAAPEFGADEVVCVEMSTRETWARLVAVLRRAQRIWGLDQRRDLA